MVTKPATRAGEYHRHRRFPGSLRTRSVSVDLETFLVGLVRVVAEAAARLVRIRGTEDDEFVGLDDPLGVHPLATAAMAHRQGLGDVLGPGHQRRDRLERPPQEVQVNLASRDQLKLTMEKRGDVVSHSERRGALEYRSCEDVVARIERLEGAGNSSASLSTAAPALSEDPQAQGGSKTE